MGKKRFLTVSALVLGVLLVLPAVTTGVLAADEGDPIVIGAPVPRASAYGQNGERGLILAAEEINAAGGIKLKGKTGPIYPCRYRE
jgi:branched-chain amino acid transport system substrate-binding protein